MTLRNADVVTFKAVSSTVYVWTVKAKTSSHGTAKASIAANTARDITWAQFVAASEARE